MYTVRKAKRGDESEIAKVHVDSWRSTYTGLIPDSFLTSLTVENKTFLWTEAIQQMDKTVGQKIIFVCEDSLGKIIGFIAGGAEREANCGFDAELYALYLYKDQQKKGLGRLLTIELIRWLIKFGYKKMRVWVLENNPSSIFYQKMGAKILPHTKNIEFDGRVQNEIAYGWDNLTELSRLGKI